MFAALGLVPLLAPYELLVRVQWTSFLSGAFVIAAVVSLVAVSLSAAAFAAALAGPSSVMYFEATSGTLRYSTSAPLLRRSERVVPLVDVERIETVTTDWSDSSPSHVLRVVLADGSHLDSGASWSLDHVEVLRSRVERFVREAQTASEDRSSA